jgi:hypothetical protein
VIQPFFSHRRNGFDTLPCHPDPDALLDVQQALPTIYDEARYGLTLDYNAPPPALPLSSSDLAWVEECVHAWRQAGS